MRTLVAGIAAAAVAGLAVAADAAPSGKKKQRDTAAYKAKQDAARRRASRTGTDAFPENYRVGTSEWWKAMEREGRAGFGDTP
jgi:hypothetical protein